jgi:hypothetical protein
MHAKLRVALLLPLAMACRERTQEGLPSPAPPPQFKKIAPPPRPWPSLALTEADVKTALNRAPGMEDYTIAVSAPHVTIPVSVAGQLMQVHLRHFEGTWEWIGALMDEKEHQPAEVVEWLRANKVPNWARPSRK